MDASLESEARVVEFHRLDATRRLLRILVPATLAVSFGSILLAYFIGTPYMAADSIGAALVGSALGVFGPTRVILGL